MQATCHAWREHAAGAKHAAGRAVRCLEMFQSGGRYFRLSGLSSREFRPRPQDSCWHERCCAVRVEQLSEADRIRLVVERDGLDAAVEWVRRTLQIYAQALDDPANFARAAEYRPRFEQSIRAFEAWLNQQDHGPRPDAARLDAPRAVT